MCVCVCVCVRVCMRVMYVRMYKLYTYVLILIYFVIPELPYGWEQVIDPVYGVYYVK